MCLLTKLKPLKKEKGFLPYVFFSPALPFPNVRWKRLYITFKKVPCSLKTGAKKKILYLVVLGVEVSEVVLVVGVLVEGQEGGLVEDLGADQVVVQEAKDEAVDP